MILMTLGFLGLVYEFTSPGAVLPGVGGGICLILGLYAMGTLPINYAGLALIVFAFLLFFLEIYATTHGFLAIGGVISFILGSLMLIPAGYEYFRIPLTFIITVAVTIGGASILLARMVWKNLHKKAVSGKEELIGAKGVVKTPLEPFGHIFILGELWRGKAVSGTIAKDTEVRVIDKEGLTLIVEPLEGVREKPSEKG
jgi:membrane-bound serine protease (ClpP class)